MIIIVPSIARDMAIIEAVAVVLIFFSAEGFMLINLYAKLILLKVSVRRFISHIIF